MTLACIAKLRTKSLHNSLFYVLKHRELLIKIFAIDNSKIKIKIIILFYFRNALLSQSRRNKI